MMNVNDKFMENKLRDESRAPWRAANLPVDRQLKLPPIKEQSSFQNNQERSRSPGKDHVTPRCQDKVLSSSLLKARASKVHNYSDFNPEEDYNFDSDEDDAGNPSTGRKTANFCLEMYRRACASANITVLSQFAKQASRSSMALTDLGLDTKRLKIVCLALVYHRTLRHLDLSSNWIAGSDVYYLTHLLTENQVITSLTLADNTLTGIGIQLLAAHMSKPPNPILRLDISGNNLTDADAVQIATIIKGPNVLRKLVLRRNKFHEKAGIEIGNALADNEVLEVLDLGWNHLRTMGAVSIAKALWKNNHLRKLLLGWNGFGYEGCSALGHALMHNTSLTSLDLTSNRVHMPALAEMLKGIVKNTSLKVLKLAYNPIPALCTTAVLIRLSKAKELPLSELDLSVTFERSLPIHRAKWLKQDQDHAADVDDDVYNIEPVRMLYYIKKNLRAIDLLLQMDKDRSFDLCREEINKAFQNQNVPLSSESLDRIMDYLDTNRDGKVDLSELIDGERRLHRKDIDVRKKEGVKRIDVDSTVNNTYSQSYSKGLDPGFADAMSEARTLSARRETSPLTHPIEATTAMNEILAATISGFT